MRISDWSSDVCSSDLVRSLDAGDHALEVFVHSPDRDGLFAAIVISLDRLGVQIQQARALDGPGGTIFDSFQVLPGDTRQPRSEEQTSELQSLMRISYAVFCLKKKTQYTPNHNYYNIKTITFLL